MMASSYEALFGGSRPMARIIQRRRVRATAIMPEPISPYRSVEKTGLRHQQRNLSWLTMISGSNRY
jgi:hypothetical protein